MNNFVEQEGYFVELSSAEERDAAVVALRAAGVSANAFEEEWLISAVGVSWQRLHELLQGVATIVCVTPDVQYSPVRGK